MLLLTKNGLEYFFSRLKTSFEKKRISNIKTSGTSFTLNKDEFLILNFTAAAITLNLPVSYDCLDEFLIQFISGGTATTLSLPSEINIGDLTIESNKIYQLNIMNNLLTWKAWDNA